MNQVSNGATKGVSKNITILQDYGRHRLCLVTSKCHCGTFWWFDVKPTYIRVKSIVVPGRLRKCLLEAFEFDVEPGVVHLGHCDLVRTTSEPFTANWAGPALTSPALREH